MYHRDKSMSRTSFIPVMSHLVHIDYLTFISLKLSTYPDKKDKKKVKTSFWTRATHPHTRTRTHKHDLA